MINQLKQNDVLELDIENLGSNGEGIARYEGMTVFVTGALPGEAVKAKITLVKKNYAVAALAEILQASTDRAVPLCPVYEICGGCQLQHLNYSSQLVHKRQQVADALERIGHLHCEVLPVLGMNQPWQYRNKMQFPVGRCGSEIVTGCYATKTHQVVDTADCLIQDAANNAVAKTVRQWMMNYGVSVYNEKTGQGLVRHVMARVGHSGGRQQVMAVLVTNGEKIPYTDQLIKLLVKTDGMAAVVQNINKQRTNVIMGKESRLLWGREYLTDNIGDLQFKISATSFFQVNSCQAEVLYGLVKDFAALQGSEVVADVYCGTGTIGLYLARQAKKVYGIEIVKSAVVNARQNAKDNGIDNAEFITGDAAVELPKLLQQGIKPDVIIADPPRAGCEGKVTGTILAVMPQKVIYVSCNPATLARDLTILTEHYEVKKVQPVDMFPHTCHVETVVLLERC